MVVKETRPFAYGRFVLRSVPATPLMIPPMPSPPSVAIEILREFSAIELVGKVYIKGPAAGWVPLDPGAVSEYEWYKGFGRKEWTVYFDMEPSGRWDVLNFRIESDERGPYVAAALKYASPQ